MERVFDDGGSTHPQLARTVSTTGAMADPPQSPSSVVSNESSGGSPRPPMLQRSSSSIGSTSVPKSPYQTTLMRIGEATMSDSSDATGSAGETASRIASSISAALDEAGLKLWKIWHTFRLIEHDKLACLALVEQCALDLLSARRMLKGKRLPTVTLVEPVGKLQDAFGATDAFLLKHSRRSFLQRRVTEVEQSAKEYQRCVASLKEALDRLEARCDEESLWSVERDEVEMEDINDSGPTSEFHKGRCRGQIVAIKVITRHTSRKLFDRGVDRWVELQHPNVLKLLGASLDPTSDPPWLLVVPYYRRGNLAHYLITLKFQASIDPLEMMLEVSQGMSYLHSEGVTHGDLKASVILLGDDLRCVVSGFARRDTLAREASSSTTTLPVSRWLAPELFQGVVSLTHEGDVYAFGIMCFEILNRGVPPWPFADDETVRRYVCIEDKRPDLFPTRLLNHPVIDIIQAAWAREPHVRPPFRKIAGDLESLRASPLPPSALASPPSFASTSRAPSFAAIPSSPSSSSTQSSPSSRASPTPPSEDSNTVASVDLPALSKLFGTEGGTAPMQTEDGYERAKLCVQRAAASVWDIAPMVAHDALSMGKGLLQLTPIPALKHVGSVLLTIWDAIQLVKDNRRACLRLAERCANAIISIHRRICKAGTMVHSELGEPLERLCDAFNEVSGFLQKQERRTFIQKLFKRKETQRDIGLCNTSLNDALAMFSIDVQIGTLELALENRAESASLRVSPNSTSGPSSPAGTSRHSLAVGATDLQNKTNISSIQELVSDQDVRDREVDRAEWQERLGSAMRDDATMLDVLEITTDEIPETLVTMQRALHAEVKEARPNVMDTSTPGDSPVLDKFDRDFLTVSIGVLVRVSQGMDVSVPSWTVTRDDIELENQIGVGFFSAVFKGRCRGRIVAIKKLDAVNTTRKLFVNEAEICMQLRHPNVLQLIGASSAKSNPPWFLVTPYYRHGSLVRYLKGLDENVPNGSAKMMLEIAQGMRYLHSEKVLHGDLKASNVLVDDNLCCIVADFGQSELKSEYIRVTAAVQSKSRGTLMWLAPEVLRGFDTTLTRQVDIYAFGILCAEVLNKGAPPWGSMTSPELLHDLVCRQRQRPKLPELYSESSQHPLSKIIRAAWADIPRQRPSFDRIAQELEAFRGTTPSRGTLAEESSRLEPLSEAVEENATQTVSGDTNTLEGPSQAPSEVERPFANWVEFS